MTSAALGSAHHQPATAFKSNPIRSATERYAQSMFWAPSLTVADEFSSVPTRRFREGKQRHRWSSERRKPDPEPARPGVVSAGECADGLLSNVCSEDEEAHRDQLLRPALGCLRVKAPAGEEPDDSEACEALDQAVCSEPDQRDRARCDPCGECDRKLDQVPGDPAPSEEARTSLQPDPLGR